MDKANKLQITDLISELGLSLNNDDLVNIVKEERARIKGHIDDMLRNETTSLTSLKHKLYLCMVYDALIENFEKYLNNQLEPHPQESC